MLGKDLDTGDDISLFIVAFTVGWNAKFSAPRFNVNFAWHNQKTGEFRPAFTTIQGKVRSTGS